LEGAVKIRSLGTSILVVIILLTSCGSPPLTLYEAAEIMGDTKSQEIPDSAFRDFFYKTYPEGIYNILFADLNHDTSDEMIVVDITDSAWTVVNIFTLDANNSVLLVHTEEGGNSRPRGFFNLFLYTDAADLKYLLSINNNVAQGNYGVLSFEIFYFDCDFKRISIECKEIFGEPITEEAEKDYNDILSIHLSASQVISSNIRSNIDINRRPEIVFQTSDAILFSYIIEDMKAYITRYNGLASDVLIPETLEGYPVVKICSKAFSNNVSIQHVVMPSNLEVIEDRAFNYCQNLKYIHLNENLKFIGVEAFAHTSISNLYLPASIETIEIGQFSNALTHMPLLDAIIVDAENQYYCVSDDVLFDYSKMNLIHVLSKPEKEEYTIPQTVRRICSGAFTGTHIRKIVGNVPELSISPCAFFGAVYLEEAEFWVDSITIGALAFYNCESLKNIVLICDTALFSNYMVIFERKAFFITNSSAVRDYCANNELICLQFLPSTA